MQMVLAENIFNEDTVKELYARKDEFDLFIFDRVMSEVRIKQT